MCLKIYGENGKTIEWATGFLNKAKNRISYYMTNEKNNLEEEKIETSDDIILFWNFGKRYGFGEPDVIVIPKNSKKPVLFIEAELTASRGDGQIKKEVIGQIERYFYLAEAMKSKNGDRLELQKGGRKFSYRLDNIPDEWQNTFKVLRKRVVKGNYKIGLLEFQMLGRDRKKRFCEILKTVKKTIGEKTAREHLCIVKH